MKRQRKHYTEVLLAWSPWPTHLGAFYEKPISQSVFRQSAWPSHTAAWGYLATAKASPLYDRVDP